MSLLRAASSSARPVARALVARSTPAVSVAVAAATVLSSAAARRSLHVSSHAAAAPASKVPVWKVDNPYTGEIVAEVPHLSPSQAAALVNQAEQAFRSWRTSSLAQRVQLVNKSVNGET